MEAFRDTLEECELRDIACYGEFFTWAGKNASEIILETLDRFVCSTKWCQLYPVARATSLEFFSFDHRPIEISLGPKTSLFGLFPLGKKKRFKFETCWMVKEEFQKIVEEGWFLAPQSSSLQERLQICGDIMETWAGSRFRKLANTLKSTRKSVFPPCVANEILGIPLLSLQSEDSRVWRFNSKGIYSVRDGYRMAIGFFDAPGCQSSRHIKKWWNFIWCLNIPSKARFFWWRLSHDFLPAEANLRAHHVPALGVCKLYNFGTDSSLHSVFFCPVMRNFWKHQPFYHFLKSAREGCTLDLCLWMRNCLSKTEFEIFAVMSWLCWKERQKMIHSNEKPHAMKMTVETSNFIHKYQSARKLHVVKGHLEHGESPSKWRCPPTGKLRLDVDASFNSDKGIFSVGGNIRNSSGNPLLVFGRRFPMRPRYWNWN
ncbi:hypothetical protein DH2020_021478 [Rehmannia glutinosa]|uniref:Reverse transcriptase zinc-binding domain-containing protein n=1 Tax=Rehmannia glutinosa TaxID=99300 RepID=A0ABR0WB24_REHGL